MEEGCFAITRDGALVTVQHVEKDAGVVRVRHCDADEEDDEFVDIEGLWPTAPGSCAGGGHETAAVDAATPEGWDMDLDSGAVAAAAESTSQGQGPLVCCALSAVGAGVDDAATARISRHGQYSQGQQKAGAPERGVFARFDIGPGVTVLKAEAYVVIIRDASDRVGDGATGGGAGESGGIRLHPAVDVRCCDNAVRAADCANSSSGNGRVGADELFGRAVAALREPALAAHASRLAASCDVDLDSVRLVLATMAQQQRAKMCDRTCTWQHVARLQAPPMPAGRASRAVKREALGQLAALLHAMMWGRAAPAHAPDVAGVCRLLMAVRCNAHPLSLDACGGAGRARAVGLFPAAAMINHTCHGAVSSASTPLTCNVACHPSADGRWLYVRTLRGVRAGEELRCSYLQNMFQPRADRERTLLQGWGIRLARPASASAAASASSTATGHIPVPDDLFGAFEVGRVVVLRQHATPDMLRLAQAVEERVAHGQQAMAANDLPGAARHFTAAAALAESTVAVSGAGGTNARSGGARLHTAHVARFEAALGLMAASQRLGDLEATARAAWAALRSWDASGLPQAHPQIAPMHWAHCRAARQCGWAHLRVTSSAQGSDGADDVCMRDFASEHLRRCAEVHRICFGEGHALFKACKRLQHGCDQ